MGRSSSRGLTVRRAVLTVPSQAEQRRYETHRILGEALRGPPIVEVADQGAVQAAHDEVDRRIELWSGEHLPLDAGSNELEQTLA
jgi:hypothetical protein